jgi:hypothetical protein
LYHNWGKKPSHMGVAEGVGCISSLMGAGFLGLASIYKWRSQPRVDAESDNF